MEEQVHIPQGSSEPLEPSNYGTPINPPIPNIPNPNKKFRFSNKLIAALLIFGAAGSGLAFSLPHIFSNKSQSPPFFLILTTGLFMIVLMGILLALAPTFGLNIKKRALILAFSINAIIVIIKFVLVPIGLYKNNAQAPFVVGNALTSKNISSPITVAIGAFLLYFFFLWLIKVHYASRFQQYLNNRVSKKTLAQTIFTNLLMLIAVFMLVLILYIFVGIFFNVGTYLSETGPSLTIIALLLLTAFLLAVRLFKSSYEQAKETRDVVAITSVFWLMLSIILLYHVMWVIFTGAIITIWPFKTVLPTPTK